MDKLFIIPTCSPSTEFYVDEHYGVKEYDEGSEIPEEIGDPFWNLPNLVVRARFQHHSISMCKDDSALHRLVKITYTRELHYGNLLIQSKHIDESIRQSLVRFYGDEINNLHRVRDDCKRQIDVLTTLNRKRQSGQSLEKEEERRPTTKRLRIEIKPNQIDSGLGDESRSLSPLELPGSPVAEPNTDRIKEFDLFYSDTHNSPVGFNFDRSI